MLQMIARYGTEGKPTSCASGEHLDLETSFLYSNFPEASGSTPDFASTR